MRGSRVCIGAGYYAKNAHGVWQVVVIQVRDANPHYWHVIWPTGEHSRVLGRDLYVRPPVDGAPPRGFAAMDPARRAAYGRRGGTTAQAAGTAHRFTPSTAAEAGRRGGLQSAQTRKEKDRS